MFFFLDFQFVTDYKLKVERRIYATTSSSIVVYICNVNVIISPTMQIKRETITTHNVRAYSTPEYGAANPNFTSLRNFQTYFLIDRQTHVFHDKCLGHGHP